MNSRQQKQKRRIVPQLMTSPSGASKHKIDALSGPLRIQNLQEESKVANQILGPGRKLYVSLAPYQQERKQVNWRKLREEAGVDEFGVVGPDGENRRPLDAYLHAITRAMTLVPDDSDSDLDGEVVLEEEGAEVSGSGSDDEGQAQDDEGKKKDNEEEDQAGTGMETNNEDEEPAAPRRKKNKNSYDYMDDFIDDSEFIQMVEFTDKRRSKHGGFVIYRGKIERDEADGDSGYEYDEETGTRKKKRQRRTDGDKKRKEETPKKKKIPYVMSDDVKVIIEDICAMAEQYRENNDGTQGGDSTSKKRKMLPVPIREALVRSQKVFQGEIDKFGASATKGMAEKLFESLGVFTSKQNLSCYVIGRLGSKYRDDVVFSSSKLKAIVSSLKAPAENSEALSDSKDPLIQYIPVVMQKKIVKQIKAGLQGESVDSEKAKVFFNSALECFPPSTMNSESLLKLIGEVEELEQKAAADKGNDKKSSKEDQNKGAALIEEMGDELSKLDFDIATRKAVEHGASESDIRACFEKHKDDEYLLGACKLLAVAGPCGLRIKYMGTIGQKHGIYRSELNIKTVASNITKCFKDVHEIIKIKDASGLYTLKAFPGVVGDPILSQKQDEKVDA